MSARANLNLDGKSPERLESPVFCTKLPSRRIEYGLPDGNEKLAPKFSADEFCRIWAQCFYSLRTLNFENRTQKQHTAIKSPIDILPYDKDFYNFRDCVLKFIKTVYGQTCGRLGMQPLPGIGEKYLAGVQFIFRFGPENLGRFIRIRCKFDELKCQLVEWPVTTEEVKNTEAFRSLKMEVDMIERVENRRIKLQGSTLILSNKDRIHVENFSRVSWWSPIAPENLWSYLRGGLFSAKGLYR